VLLEGLHIPLTTPFQADGRVALPKLAANVARYSKTPAAGLIVLGPSGEPTLLSDDETRDVLRTAAEGAAPEKVLIAGIARDSVRSVLALADFAAQLHYDAILVGDPGLRVTNIALPRNRRLMRLAFFQTIADCSPLPVVLLRPPGEETMELTSHPNVLGLADGLGIEANARFFVKSTDSIQREVTVTSTFAAVTARMRLAAETTPAPSLVSAASLTGSASGIAEPPALAPALRTRSKSVRFQVLSGNSGSLLDALKAGATGIAPAFAAAAPQACYEVYAAWKDGDTALAEEKQARIREAAALAESLGPGGLKYACDLNGYAAGLPRLPHLPPDGSQRYAVEAAMRGLRN
jgi:4-hydroxy-2-oxoglutarate aldolase